ncbi:P-selectin [Suncus etruscus]|uniref:P-selectin n=1 Tax=Suncus etruscus TaxID=109475 RepID=UPI00210FF76C|nr:P-selectin [Suncus etruscus]
MQRNFSGSIGLASCLKSIWNWKSKGVVFRTTQVFYFGVLITELIFPPEVSAWTYNYSTKAYTWNYSRSFCQKYYTDLVAIQNQQEIEYLNENIPPYSSYYWIGIRKLNNTWTWVGTKKALTEEAENWADNEPNNEKNNQDCVEMYIQRETESGKWNDEPCGKKKRALCYTASCKDQSCSQKGECVETIGNYSCACYPGFYGPKCEFVSKCEELDLPAHVLSNCSHPLGNFSFNSKCSFHCASGYVLSGPRELECLASGMWTNKPPECTAITCPELLAPEASILRCTGTPQNASVGTTCHFSCKKGFQLEGFDHVDCTAEGQWTTPLPTCRGARVAVTQETRCQTPLIPEQGIMSCKHHLGRFGVNTTCYFACKAGFALTGQSQLRCRDSGRWTTHPPVCRAVKCSKLNITEPMVVNCSSPWGNASFGTTCSFHCPEMQFLNGSLETACQADGQWSAPMPTCQAGQLTLQQILAYIGAAVASTAGLATGGTFLALLRRRSRRKDDGKKPLNPHSHLGVYGVFTNAAFDSGS